MEVMNSDAPEGFDMKRLKRRTALSVPVAERSSESCTPSTTADIQT
jgi:hypothetical protein